MAPGTRPHRGPKRRPLVPRLPPPLLAASSLVLLALLVLPTLVLLLRALRPEALQTLLRPAAVEALRLSLVTTSISMALTLVLGTPVAYLLARYRFAGRRLLDMLIDIPVVLPPVVAGVSLLLVFGRRGVIGAPLGEAGVDIAFTTVAVVLAQLFVASPFYVRTLKAGFAAAPRELEDAALIDGASRWGAFWRITWPLTLPFLLEGTVLAWARALGEFGATIVFAGSLSGVTRTMPLAIYAALESDLEAALALSALLAVAAFGLLFLVRLLVHAHAPADAGESSGERLG